jgi:hypothetical protein
VDKRGNGSIKARRGAGAKRSRKFRRRRKLGLMQIVLDLPFCSIIAPAWCVKNNLPINTPPELLPAARIKSDLVELLLEAVYSLAPSHSLIDASWTNAR